jgi:hypothetical protein
MSKGVAFTLAQFTEPVMSTFLYYRNCYPPEAFKRVLMFGKPCWRCQITEVGDYLSEVCVSLRALLTQPRDSELTLTLAVMGEAGGLEERLVLRYPCEGRVSRGDLQALNTCFTVGPGGFF